VRCVACVWAVWWCGVVCSVLVWRGPLLASILFKTLLPLYLYPLVTRPHGTAPSFPPPRFWRARGTTLGYNGTGDIANFNDIASSILFIYIFVVFFFIKIYYYYSIYITFWGGRLLLRCMRAREREHTTCASVPGPRHRSNTTLSISRLLASSQQPAGLLRGPPSTITYVIS
jgi:hypothetical protein